VNYPLEILRVLQGTAEGDAQLLPLVCEQLRALAAARLKHEPLSAVVHWGLVYEAWLQLGTDHQLDAKSRARFFSAAAEAMRRGLSDRGEIALMNKALEKFAETEPLKAELVKLRYFGGLTLPEASVNLGIPEATARRWWAYARAWLQREIAAA
jgi:hypothetical protein